MPILYVVPTPIGNLEDITIRAIKALTHNNVLLCEDTRNTRKLLTALNIDSSRKVMLPYFEHNERRKLLEVLNMLKNGEDIVLVSDAGMPLISDPGYPLIHEIRTNHPDIKLEILPGPSSILNALVSSGFPTDKFTFLGFVPRKPNDKKKFFESALESSKVLKSTFIFFDSPLRFSATAEAMVEILPSNAEICVCREMTKKFETVFVATAGNFMEFIKNNAKALKGETVVLFRFID
jgi:16S rRNA (cytidine1402-2'-O)-methyltransferase